MKPQPNVRIRFLGAAGTVTGSRYLITYGEKKILIDCGLFQGLKELRLKNWDQFPIDPKEIEAIILTHAHVDHSGYIPRLVKQGFKGPVYCTPATYELSRILLKDTGFLQEEEAKYLNKRKISKHQPALPLFSKKEAEDSFQFFTPHDFEKPFDVLPGVRVSFHYAGHILGASMVVLDIEGKRIGFSGDIGRMNDPLLYPPGKMPDVDHLVVESTYGDRQHAQVDPHKQLESILNRAFEAKSVVMIPAFAVGRAQELMYYLSGLKSSGRIPKMPMYLNSPMATSVTKLLSQFKELHKVSDVQCAEMNRNFQFVESIEDSKKINERAGPMVVISASGMVTGGRILHHLEAFASDPKNIILISGFQAEGTRGRKIQEGASEIKIHGQLVPIRAQVEVLENTSAHADYLEIQDWLSRSDLKPQSVFITHGEDKSAFALKEHLEKEFAWKCIVPSQDQEFSL